MPDERNQFVQTNIQGEEWADYDSCGIEQACKLITLGYPVWLEGMAEEVKGWPLDCEGRDRFNTMTLVYNRALRIAKSSVHAGTIKEHDTPANWIKWAKSKGYSVAHLMPADAKGAKVKAGADTSPSGGDWKVQARAIADEYFDIDTKGGCRDSLKGYSKRVMELMQKRGIKGARGIIDNPATIMREALQGEKWWATKLPPTKSRWVSAAWMQTTKVV